MKRVVGEFDIGRVLEMPVQSLWDHTKHHAGICRDSFFSYFAGKARGYAIEIGAVRTYAPTLCVNEHFGLRAPQSFAYLEGAWPLTPQAANDALHSAVAQANCG